LVLKNTWRVFVWGDLGNIHMFSKIPGGFLFWGDLGNTGSQKYLEGFYLGDLGKHRFSSPSEVFIWRTFRKIHIHIF